jgi:hypothetical protein
LSSKQAFGQLAFENRTNKNIYKVFCEIFGEHRLWCTIDKWGVMRGTKNLQINGNVEDRDQWRYELKLHWDANPWLLCEELKKGAPQRYQVHTTYF